MCASNENAILLDKWRTECVRLERRNAEMASVILRTEAILTRALGRPVFRVVDEAILALRTTPTTSLAVRDAEKWDEGRQSIGFDLLRPADENGRRQPTENPYRTPQQGDPETTRTLFGGVRDLRECVVCRETATISNATKTWENRHRHSTTEQQGETK